MGCSPGAVVYREEMFELIQYSPTTTKVRERPMLMVPPQLGRYYIWISPRSVRWWSSRFPTGCRRSCWCGATRARTAGRSRRMGPGGLHVGGRAGMHSRARDRRRRRSEPARVLRRRLHQRPDPGTSGGAGRATRALGDLLGHHARHPTTQPGHPPGHAGISRELNKLADNQEIVDAKRIASHFAWLRPKDLVFGHAIHNWLLGEEPSAYDLLAWTDDQVNMSAKFIRDAITPMCSGAFIEPGAVKLSGTPIDLSQVKVDTFIVAAQTDHITTWRPCYMTSQLLGGHSEVVVVNKGHIQTIVSPIEKSRQKYWAGPAAGPDPDEWLHQTEQFSGSWWPHWGAWLTARSGSEKPASTTLGSLQHPAREPAPGLYVRE